MENEVGNEIPGRKRTEEQIQHTFQDARVSMKEKEHKYIKLAEQNGYSRNNFESGVNCQEKGSGEENEEHFI